LKDVDWVNTMHEKLNNFTRNQVWELVKRPKGHNVIGTKIGLSQQARSRWDSCKEQSKTNGSRLH
jgi:hypothetical protein